MHPAIKIVTFLLFGAAVAFGHLAALLLGSALLLVLYLAGPAEHLRVALRMLKRMRWFFLSIAVVYLLFTPGRLLFSAWPWGPTLEGLSQGGQRVMSLVLIVLAVNLLLRSTPRPALVSAILWCLAPLALLGLPRERVAVRIALTLEAIDSVQSIYRNHPRSNEPLIETASGDIREEPDSEHPPRNMKERLWRIGAAAQRLVVAVIERAESAPVQAIEVPKPSHPPLWQWLYPLLLGAAFVILRELASW